VRRVAEGIEDRGDFVGDRCVELERVERRNDEILGKAALAIDAHAHGVAAQVPAARAAVAAITAGDVAFAGDAVTDREPLHFAADLDDLAHVFVAHGHRHGNRLLGPLVPEVDVHVGAADRGLGDLDQHVVRAHLGLRDFFHPDPGFGLRLDQCLHAAMLQRRGARLDRCIRVRRVSG
jgi:hypothetical protein